MMKRFVERFELWIGDVAEDIDDRLGVWLLFVAFAMIAGDAYSAITTHHLSWGDVLGVILLLAFAVLYIRRARWTWILLLLLAIRCLVSVPSTYTSGSNHLRPSARFFLAGFMFALAVAGVVFSLIIRKRFADSTPII